MGHSFSMEWPQPVTYTVYLGIYLALLISIILLIMDIFLLHTPPENMFYESIINTFLKTTAFPK